MRAKGPLFQYRPAARVRGVVVGEEDAAGGRATGSGIARARPAAGSVRRSRTWVAEYYGSTPARALALVAAAPVRRGERQSPASGNTLAGEKAPALLTPAQERVLGRIEEAFAAGGGHFLLHGDTGSGKTEVYLRACASALEHGRDAIVLVPEIALTLQTLGRFRARFGDLVAVIHSGLTEAERRDERERIAAREARIVVGARSAVFAPVHALGVICVDEEHDPSYKQESDPRYDARTVAAKRASLESAVAVYGSATPRPESWERLERLSLGGRIGADLPSVLVVDMRREAGYPLSSALLQGLAAIESGGGRAILLLGTAGTSRRRCAPTCGITLRCPTRRRVGFMVATSSAATTQ